MYFLAIKKAFVLQCVCANVRKVVVFTVSVSDQKFGPQGVPVSVLLLPLY